MKAIRNAVFEAKRFASARDLCIVNMLKIPTINVGLSYSTKETWCLSFANRCPRLSPSSLTNISKDVSASLILLCAQVATLSGRLKLSRSCIAAACWKLFTMRWTAWTRRLNVSKSFISALILQLPISFSEIVRQRSITKNAACAMRLTRYDLLEDRKRI